MQKDVSLCRRCCARLCGCWKILSLLLIWCLSEDSFIFTNILKSVQRIYLCLNSNILLHRECYEKKIHLVDLLNRSSLLILKPDNWIDCLLIIYDYHMRVWKYINTYKIPTNRYFLRLYKEAITYNYQVEIIIPSFIARKNSC